MMCCDNNYKLCAVVHIDDGQQHTVVLDSLLPLPVCCEGFLTLIHQKVPAYEDYVVSVFFNFWTLSLCVNV